MVLECQERLDTLKFKEAALNKVYIAFKPNLYSFCLKMAKV